MNTPASSFLRARGALAAAALVLLLALGGCKQQQSAREYAYVTQPQVALRDRVAAVYNKVGTVKNGERVEVLGRDRRFLKVRNERGEEGWMEQRFLAGQEVYDTFQQLAREHAQAPVQAKGVTRAELNMHITGERWSPVLYRIPENQPVQMLKRTWATRAKDQPRAADGSLGPVEDWWLVRDPQGHVGWVLGRMVDVDVPLEVAQYAEGQRIVAYFVLNEVADTVFDENKQPVERKVPQILMLLNTPKDGLPQDYNQARVFTWNARRDRYETAYRERNLNGVLPVTVGWEEFDKEGRLPFFLLRVKDEAGNTAERKYKMNGVMVRRVLAPGEQPSKPQGRRRR